MSDIPLLGAESLESHAPTHATAMNSNGGDAIWVGCTDGAIRCFDVRMTPMERSDGKQKVEQLTLC